MTIWRQGHQAPRPRNLLPDTPVSLYLFPTLILHSTHERSCVISKTKFKKTWASILGFCSPSLSLPLGKSTCHVISSPWRSSCGEMLRPPLGCGTSSPDGILAVCNLSWHVDTGSEPSACPRFLSHRKYIKKIVYVLWATKFWGDLPHSSR